MLPRNPTRRNLLRTQAWTALALVATLSAAPFAAASPTSDPPVDERNEWDRALSVIADSESALRLARDPAGSAQAAKDYEVSTDGLFYACCEMVEDMATYAGGERDFSLEPLDAYDGQVSLTWDYYSFGVNWWETRDVGYVHGILSVGCTDYYANIVALQDESGQATFPLLFSTEPSGQGAQSHGNETPEAEKEPCSNADLTASDVHLHLYFQIARQSIEEELLGATLRIGLDTNGTTSVTVRELAPPQPEVIGDPPFEDPGETEESDFDDGSEDQGEDLSGQDEPVVLPGPSMAVLVAGLIGLMALLRRRNE